MAKVARVVEITLKPGAHPAFDAIIRSPAAGTLAEEPGCERCDVLQPRYADGTPDLSSVLLDEVDRDAAALEAHRQNPRLAPTREAYADLVTGRTIQVCTPG